MTSEPTTIKSGEMLSAEATLRSYVEEMLVKDKKFVGLSSYVADINFYWSYSIPTACAGYGFIFFNPDFWNRLIDPEKKKTVIAHEIWHLVLEHLSRGEGYDPDSYNQAADHVINLGLKDDGFVMGEGMDFGGIEPCCDPAFKGMSTEQIYNLIHTAKASGNSKYAPSMGTPSKSQIEDLVKAALENQGKDLQQQIEEDHAKIEGAKKIGSETGNECRLLKTDQIKVKILEASYEEIFEEYLVDPLSGGKRTYLRPSRRPAFSHGLKLKGKQPKRGRLNRLTHLVYALDVSGSITSHQANQFLRSAKTIKDLLKPKLMTVILWDTQIKFEKTFREDEKLDNIRVQAGGGTSLNCVYKRVQDINPEALVIFTDLEVYIPPKPSWETIWFVPNKCCSTNGVTYGKVYLVPE